MLKSASIDLATAQFPQRRNQSMLAPCQISSRVVRVPKTASHSPTKASSLWMSLGQERAVGLGEHDQVARRLHEARDGTAWP